MNEQGTNEQVPVLGHDPPNAQTLLGFQQSTIQTMPFQFATEGDYSAWLLPPPLLPPANLSPWATLDIQLRQPVPVSGDSLSVRIETLIRLDLTIRSSPLGAPLAWDCLQLPQTTSVRSTALIGPRRPLILGLIARGATSDEVFNHICPQCRTRKAQRGSDIIDFDSPQDIIDLVHGQARITFRLKCYAYHHNRGDTEYTIEAVLQDEWGVLIDSRRLANRFKVMSHVDRSKYPLPNTNLHLESMLHAPVAPSQFQDEDLRRRLPYSQRDLTLHISPRSGPSVSTIEQNGTSSSYFPDTLQAGWVPALAAPKAPAWDPEGTVTTEHEACEHPPREQKESYTVPIPHRALPSPPALQQSMQEIPDRTGIICDLNSPGVTENSSSGSSAGTNRPLTDNSSENRPRSCSEQPAPTPGGQLRTARTRTSSPNDAPYIEEVAPGKGPVTGGLRVYIIGDNFPENDHLYVRFGDAFARAKRRNEHTLWCHLPPAASAGKVKVTLTRAPSSDAPEIGWSEAHFEYRDRRAELFSWMLKSIYEKQEGIDLSNMLASMRRSPESLNPQLPASNHLPSSTVPAQSAVMDTNVSVDFDRLEDIAIQFLSSYSQQLDWSQTLSLTNEYGQTLAHITAMSGYVRLLHHLITWGIDLNVPDVTGTTALHCAYIRGDAECAGLLIRAGVNQLVLDDLGRSPAEVGPSLNSILDPGVETADRYSAAPDGIRYCDYDTEMIAAEDTAWATTLLVRRWALQVDNGRNSGSSSPAISEQSTASSGIGRSTSLQEREVDICSQVSLVGMNPDSCSGFLQRKRISALDALHTPLTETANDEPRLPSSSQMTPSLTLASLPSLPSNHTQEDPLPTRADLVTTPRESLLHTAICQSPRDDDQSSCAKRIESEGRERPECSAPPTNRVELPPVASADTKIPHLLSTIPPGLFAGRGAAKCGLGSPYSTPGPQDCFNQPSSGTHIRAPNTRNTAIHGAKSGSAPVPAARGRRRGR